MHWKGHSGNGTMYFLLDIPCRNDLYIHVYVVLFNDKEGDVHVGITLL